MTPNNKKITQAFCKGKVLVFFPLSVEEAMFIQHQFFAMGFTWGKGTYGFEDGSTTIVSDARVLEGLCLDKKGLLFARPNDEQLVEGLLCASGQFGETYEPPHEQLLGQFRELAARLDRIEAQLKPTKLDKPSLKGPKP